MRNLIQVTALLGGIASLLIAAWQLVFERNVAESSWHLAVSVSLIAYFAHVLQQRRKSKDELDGFLAQMNRVLVGISHIEDPGKDYWEVALRASPHVDQRFWSAFSDLLQESGSETAAHMAWITRKAATDGDVAVPKKLAYNMMRIMLNLLERGDVYFATMTVEELSDRDTGPLFDQEALGTLKDRGVKVRRVLLLSYGEIGSLNEFDLAKLRSQIEAGVEFFCLVRELEVARNFGLYGDKCLGEMIGGWNTFRFSPENVERGRELWQRLQLDIRRLELVNLVTS